MDGTLGSQTAWMLDGSGVTITSGEELADVIREGARLGWPVGVHAIGDRANREALDAFESTRDVWAPLGLRHRIEHAQCLAPEDVGRFAALGVACSVQFSHAPSIATSRSASGPSRSTVPTPSVRCGSRARSSRTARTRRSRSSTPSPVSAQGVRRTIDERPAWHPEQCLTIEEALTRDVRQSGVALGRRAAPRQAPPGYLADLVVLSRDPLECPPDELESVEVVATMVGGRWVHNPRRRGISAVQSARGQSHDAPRPRGADVLGRGRG